jgi:hypothetical protein
MATGKPARKTTPRPARARAATVPALQRRVARLETQLETVRRRHARQLASVRREGDRRLAGMVQEIAQLRHYQAREEALTRLLAEREAELAALRERPAMVDPLEPAHPLT